MAVAAGRPPPPPWVRGKSLGAKFLHTLPPAGCSRTWYLVPLSEAPGRMGQKLGYPDIVYPIIIPPPMTTVRQQAPGDVDSCS
jgi:hypothetical protein